MQQKREGEGNFDFKFIDLDYILLKRGGKRRGNRGRNLLVGGSTSQQIERLFFCSLQICHSLYLASSAHCRGRLTRECVLCVCVCSRKWIIMDGNEGLKGPRKRRFGIVQYARVRNAARRVKGKTDAID